MSSEIKICWGGGEKKETETINEPARKSKTGRREKQRTNIMKRLL